ncbi:MAG: DUF6090 family protein [Terricaulis sp.]
MILRRTMEHLRRQDWVAVTIEFVIVVLGVFVATQVSNWNEEREARARAAVYGARLTEDLRYEAWQTEFLIAYYGEVLTNAERAVGALTDGPRLSDEQLLISAYRATQYLYYGTRRATYDEMVATGDIGLIADRRLRETALTLYSDPTINMLTDDARNSDYRIAFRRAVPADVQRALLEHCGDKIIEPGDFEGIVGSLDYPCALGLPEAKIAAAIRRLRSNPELVSALQLRFADIETAIGNLEQGTPGLLENLRAISGRTAP